MADVYCPTTGKRKYGSKKQARRGLRRLTSEKLGIYLCPDCHFYHLRNQERFSRQHSRSAMPKSKKKQKPKKKPENRKKRKHDCDFCLSPGWGVATLWERRICLGCATLLKRGPWGRHKLSSMLEEADRIQAATRGSE